MKKPSAADIAGLVPPRNRIHRGLALAPVFALGAAVVLGLALPSRAERGPDAPPPRAEKTVLADASSDQAGDQAGGEIQIAMAAPLVAQSVAKAVRENIRREFTVRKGDTMMHILARAGIPQRQAYAAFTAMKGVYDPRRILPGQRITLSYQAVGETDKDAASELRLRRLDLAIDVEREISVRRGDDERFSATEIKKELELRLVRAEGVITSSLYKAGDAAGLPVPVLVDLIRIYSWDVDFQRDIRSKDSFEIVFERFYGEDGSYARDGEIVFARLTLSGTPRAYYRFEYDTGLIDYFDETGQSARKPLLRTPVDGARLTSGYGRRRHPVLGYSRVHRGVDFAASRGTPVYAAGDGRITQRGRKGAYGRYIRIRHNSRYSTAYAHLRGYKRGLRAGSRVRQGQVIGYVGSSGRTTGSHLHYEIIAGGRAVNPLRVKLPSGRKLRGKKLAAFTAARQATEQRIAALAGPIVVSQR